MKMTDFNFNSKEIPELSMSSLTAFQMLISVTDDSEVDLNRLGHLRRTDPSYSHLDWIGADKWKEFLDATFTSDLRSFYQMACLTFVEANPMLIDLSRNGREALISNLSGDEIQVFRNAGLLEKILDMESVLWWDKLKLQGRKNLDEYLLQQGRKAEKWTIENELDKFLFAKELEPSWIALDGDHYGYDILSYRFLPDGVPFAILIEVKSFLKVSDPHFYLSINEWKKAGEAHPNYLFYIWCIESKEYKILTFEDVKPHIPLNSGSGHWQNVLVRISW